MKWKTAQAGIRASSSVLFLGVSTAIIVANLLFDPFLSTNQERRLQRAVLLQPFDSGTHEALGAYYREGNMSAAQREYILAASLPKSQSPAGGEISLWGQERSVYQQKQQSEEDRHVWERVYAAAPDYHYAAVKLAQLSYQAGDLPGARKYFLIAREQAPWEPTIASLAGALR